MSSFVHVNRSPLLEMIISWMKSALFIHGFCLIPNDGWLEDDEPERERSQTTEFQMTDKSGMRIAVSYHSSWKNFYLPFAISRHGTHVMVEIMNIKKPTQPTSHSTDCIIYTIISPHRDGHGKWNNAIILYQSLPQLSKFMKSLQFVIRWLSPKYVRNLNLDNKTIPLLSETQTMTVCKEELLYIFLEISTNLLSPFSTRLAKPLRETFFIKKYIR